MNKAKPETKSETTHETASEATTTNKRFPDLKTLNAHHGGSTLEAALNLVEGISDTDLVQLGTEVSTTRVDDDALRIYSAATEFFEKESAEFKKHVRLSPTVIKIGVWAAYMGHQAYEELAAHKVAKKTAITTLNADIGKLMEQVKTLRDQLTESLRGVVAQHPARLEEIRLALRPTATGKTESGPEVALQSLVDLGEKWLKSKDKGLQSRAELYLVTKEYLAECEALAKEARAHTEVKEAPKSVAASNLTQAKVDHWDGVNITILQHVVKAFATAHQREPRVPKLDFISLRSLLTKRSKAETTEPTNTSGGNT